MPSPVYFRAVDEAMYRYEARMEHLRVVATCQSEYYRLKADLESLIADRECELAENLSIGSFPSASTSSPAAMPFSPPGTR